MIPIPSEKPQMIETGEAMAILPVQGGKPITIIGTKAIRDGFDASALQQAINSRMAPGVTDLVLNPDAHAGYGAPVGCVMVSPDHVYPGPVGVDIKCSMSLLQMDIPEDQLKDKAGRRAVINAMLERLPTGPGRGQRHCKKSRKVGENLGFSIATEGASAENLYALGIPASWAGRCEDAFHGNRDQLVARLHRHLGVPSGHHAAFDTFTGQQFKEKVEQLGSYGGGNHFGECNIVRVGDNDRARAAADVFGLRNGCASFLSHCGSRGFGYKLANHQFKVLQNHFQKWSIPLPGGDKDLVYAPIGTTEASDYIDDMSLGANFATVNHLLINALVLEAFQEVFPGTKGDLVYLISHNIARQEVVDGRLAWVHRKGATRAFPAGHHALKGTIYEATGHPILLPGNPRDGSCIMVADEGASKSCYSVNHGAGRAMGRKAASRALNQAQVDQDFETYDILSNCRQYPIDEAPAAYKDFNEVLASVSKANLASEVARLQARFVIKDSDMSNNGAA